MEKNFHISKKGVMMDIAAERAEVSLPTKRHEVFVTTIFWYDPQEEKSGKLLITQEEFNEFERYSKEDDYVNFTLLQRKDGQCGNCELFYPKKWIKERMQDFAFIDMEHEESYVKVY